MMIIFALIFVLGIGFVLYGSATSKDQTEQDKTEEMYKKMRERGKKYKEDMKDVIETLDETEKKYRKGMKDVKKAHNEAEKEIEKLTRENRENCKKIERIREEINNGSQLVDEKLIRTYFKTALYGAEKELDIVSSWMNFYVVNDELINCFKNLLQKGVQIKIVYGIGDTLDERRQRTESVAEKLRLNFAHYANFHLKAGNTHEKLFICDDNFYVFSSLNILSKGYSYDTWDEGGDCSTNINAIKERRKKYFNF